MISIKKQYRVMAAYEMHSRKYSEAARIYRIAKANNRLTRAFVGASNVYDLQDMETHKRRMKRHLKALHRLEELYPTLLLRPF